MCVLSRYNNRDINLIQSSRQIPTSEHTGILITQLFKKNRNAGVKNSEINFLNQNYSVECNFSKFYGKVGDVILENYVLNWDFYSTSYFVGIFLHCIEKSRFFLHIELLVVKINCGFLNVQCNFIRHRKSFQF